MAMDGIYVNGVKTKFLPEDILEGDITAYTEPLVEAVEDWLDENVSGGETLVVDSTLSISGAAADAKVTGDAVSELNTHLIDLEDDVVLGELSADWTQNRVMTSSNNLVEVESTVFANSGFITTASDCVIKVSSGYKIYVWACHYDELGHTGLQITSAWTDETVNYTYNETFPYIIICAQKNPSAVITAEEAETAIHVYQKNESIFEKKTVVSAVADRVTALESNTSDLDSIRSNISSLTNKVSNALDNEIIVPYMATQGRILVSNNTIVLQSSNDYCNTGYIDLSVLGEVDVTVASGYKICGWTSDNNNYEFVTYAPRAMTNGYVTETVNTYADSVRSYAIFSIAKVNGGAITPSEAQNAVSVIYKNDNSLTGAVDSLDTRVTALESASNSLTTNAIPTKGQILYEADKASSDGYICNAVAYSDGIIIACRTNGKVVRIGYDGTEETLLSLSGSKFEWRGLWMDSNENVYASPHASNGTMNVSDRGLYRLVKGENTMTKVISLYNPSSEVESETEENNDTIWTMCEDGNGNLYAGVYAHTIRANPAVYKSTNKGVTWSYVFNFKKEGITPSGMHIHTIIYSKWQDALYCIVGEVNTIFKSTDGAETWSNLNVALTVKGSAMLATKNGIFVGSDGAYNCDIDCLRNDDSTHDKVFRGWANTIFAIRQSDITGFMYAFTKIDSSVNSESYYPPVGAIADESVITTWHNSVGDTIYNTWKDYHDSVVDKYPDDAVRPQHYGIIVSRDGGTTWEPLKRFSCASTSASGCWTTGWFINGECLTGRYVDGAAVAPVVISEGKHKYVTDGCDLDGEIFVRTNASSVVELVN